MGTQSSVVLTGFFLLHIALVLNVVSLSTPSWIEASSYNYTDYNLTNSTNVTRLGLWQMCSDGDCTSSTPQPVWFHAVQGVFTTGVALCFLALLFNYGFFASNQLRGSPLNALIVFVLLIADFALLSGLIVFGVKADDTENVFPPIRLAWGYYVGVAGLIVTAVTTGLEMWEGVLLRGETRPYTNLT